MMKKTGLISAGIAWLLTAGTAQAASDAFKVCADPNNPPYSDQKGGGFENKIAELFAGELDKKLVYTWFPQRMGFIRNTLKAKEPESEDYKCDVVMGLPTGFDQAATTKPYYRSTYALVYVKKKGWDDVHSAAALDTLPPERKAKLRIAMFDGSPATTWMLKHNLVEQGVPYQSMTADAAVNTTQTVEKELLAGNIDMAIVWGPMAGYLVYHNKPGTFALIPMQSEEGVRFDYAMSMGVRIPDKARKEQLEALIDKKAPEIEALLRKYHVPLLDKDGKLLTPAEE
ncbi:MULTISPECIES: substrate-binding domain-containing protein [Methylococcus]|jgi:quinoprotein dehydrogenase-associated probable ABC transporter substrate-binding protein|uniref:MxaJ protein n=2 Tax=Methylococcus capsulatus TaxID=414 RepID=Q60C11_METCA|nr:substrate-binding domain-containing protein [Methylococcus capsulatus]AAU90454.1 MxaJ protein [Methylococcus capsulatus str. Bath]QXP89753.1 substrate-binding domain-containing protein [Methylococcus capsulatus]CAI8774474.1 mxaJ protein [Methylococcus capsulatus]